MILLLFPIFQYPFHARDPFDPLPEEEVGEGVVMVGEQRAQGNHLTPVPSQVVQLYTLPI